MQIVGFSRFYSAVKKQAQGAFKMSRSRFLLEIISSILLMSPIAGCNLTSINPTPANLAANATRSSAVASGYSGPVVTSDSLVTSGTVNYNSNPARTTDLALGGTAKTWNLWAGHETWATDSTGLKETLSGGHDLFFLDGGFSDCTAQVTLSAIDALDAPSLYSRMDTVSGTSFGLTADLGNQSRLCVLGCYFVVDPSGQRTPINVVPEAGDILQIVAAGTTVTANVIRAGVTAGTLTYSNETDNQTQTSYNLGGMQNASRFRDFILENCN